VKTTSRTNDNDNNDNYCQPCVVTMNDNNDDDDDDNDHNDEDIERKLNVDVIALLDDDDDDDGDDDDLKKRSSDTCTLPIDDDDNNDHNSYGKHQLQAEAKQERNDHDDNDASSDQYAADGRETINRQDRSSSVTAATSNLTDIAVTADDRKENHNDDSNTIRYGPSGHSSSQVPVLVVSRKPLTEKFPLDMDHRCNIISKGNMKNDPSQNCDDDDALLLEKRRRIEPSTNAKREDDTKAHLSGKPSVGNQPRRHSYPDSIEHSSHKDVVNPNNQVRPIDNDCPQLPVTDDNVVSGPRTNHNKQSRHCCLSDNNCIIDLSNLSDDEYDPPPPRHYYDERNEEEKSRGYHHPYHVGATTTANNYPSADHDQEQQQHDIQVAIYQSLQKQRQHRH
jgi:hypothetical protein